MFQTSSPQTRLLDQLSEVIIGGMTIFTHVKKITFLGCGVCDFIPLKGNLISVFLKVAERALG